MTPSAFLEAMERACTASHNFGMNGAGFLRACRRALGLREQDSTWPAIAERLAELAAEARRCEDRAKGVGDG